MNMETTKKTPEGWYVYRGSDAGAPDLHDSGSWYYQPDDCNTGDIYSEGYPTEQAALAACLDWISQQEFDAECLKSSHADLQKFLTATKDNAGWLVRDSEGGVWRPNAEAAIEIGESTDAVATAQAICDREPTRGTWSA